MEKKRHTEVPRLNMPKIEEEKNIAWPAEGGPTTSARRTTFRLAPSELSSKLDSVKGPKMFKRDKTRSSSIKNQVRQRKNTLQQMRDTQVVEDDADE